MTELQLESRIDVYQDNYGDWRWVLVEGGEALNRSNGYFDEAMEAAQDAREAYNHTPILVDGASMDISKLPEPPKIDALLESARAGIPPQPTMTDEQKRVAEETRERLRGMAIKADEDAAALVEAEKALSEEPTPDAGMEEPPAEQQARAKARGAGDAAPQEEPDDPIAKQVRKRRAVQDE